MFSECTNVGLDVHARSVLAHGIEVTHGVLGSNVVVVICLDGDDVAGVFGESRWLYHSTQFVGGELDGIDAAPVDQFGLVFRTLSASSIRRSDAPT